MLINFRGSELLGWLTEDGLGVMAVSMLQSIAADGVVAYCEERLAVMR